MKVEAIPGTRFFGIQGDTSISAAVAQTGLLDWDNGYWASIPELTWGGGRLALDVGAFIGDTTQILLQLGWNVIGFEAMAAAAAAFRLNHPNVVLHEAVVGDGRTGSIFYEETGGNAGAMFAIPNWSGPKTLTIDSLNLNPALIKIDVEGFEPFVLDGCAETIRRCRPLLHVEVNWHGYMRYGFTEADILNRITQHGYKTREVVRLNERQYDILAIPN